jgi:hypothetical protein
MANYESRLERLEQQVSRARAVEPFVSIMAIDGDERPYDCVEYRGTVGGEAQMLVRGESETAPELERRACEAWGLTGRPLLRLHIVCRNAKTGMWYTDAEYEAIGASGVHAINHSASPTAR